MLNSFDKSERTVVKLMFILPTCYAQSYSSLFFVVFLCTKNKIENIIVLKFI